VPEIDLTEIITEITKHYPWRVKIEDRKRSLHVLRENFRPLQYFVEQDEIFFLRPRDADLFRGLLYVY
jgi:hypothetical protein